MAMFGLEVPSDRKNKKEIERWLRGTRPMTYGERWVAVLFSLNRAAQYRTLRRLAFGHGPGLEDRVELEASPSKEINEATIRVALSRLKAKGFAESNEKGWRITDKGKKWFETTIKKTRHPKRPVSFREKNLIISFDIPEQKENNRRWLRAELRALGFEMLHQSLWIGPAPLPKETIQALQDLNLLPFLKFFEAKPTDIVQIEKNLGIHTPTR